jgi:hypothetical protein
MPKTGLFKSFAIQCMDLKALSQEVFITVATHLLEFFSCMDPLILSWIKLEFQYTCKFGEEKDTCKQPESSGYCPSLSCPEYVSLLVHIQTRVNYDRFCSLKFFPANVACVLNEVEVLWQIGENVKKIYSFKEQVH